MSTIIEKIADLEYNELITLNLIEKDEDLCGMFKDDVNLPFNILYRMSKDGTLSEDIKTMVFDFFDKIITCKKTYVEKYQRLQANGPEIQAIALPETQAIVELGTQIAPPTKPNSTPKKTSNLPRRIGRDTLKKDIEAQGTKPSNIHLALAAIIDMKNQITKLERYLIKDMRSEVKDLIDEDYLNVISTRGIIEARSKKIFAKKSKTKKIIKS